MNLEELNHGGGASFASQLMWTMDELLAGIGGRAQYGLSCVRSTNIVIVWPPPPPIGLRILPPDDAKVDGSVAVALLEEERMITSQWPATASYQRSSYLSHEPLFLTFWL